MEGLKPPKLASPAFQALVVQSLDDEALAPLLRPLVAAVERLDGQVAGLDKGIARRAKASSACKRLMTAPGVGPQGNRVKHLRGDQACEELIVPGGGLPSATQ